MNGSKENKEKQLSLYYQMAGRGTRTQLADIPRILREANSNIIQILKRRNMQKIEQAAKEAANIEKESIRFIAEHFFKKGANWVMNNTSECKKADIRERVRTVEDAYREVGKFRGLDGSERIQGFADACVVTEALNEGWKPDWSSTKESKWYPVFWVRRMNGEYVPKIRVACEEAIVPSCLHFRTRDLAEYAAKQFIDVYKKFML